MTPLNPNSNLNSNIVNWWNNRLNEGCQLAKIEDYTASVDYKGSEPWKNKIRVGALHSDFCRMHGYVDYQQFIKMFAGISGITNNSFVVAYGTQYDKEGRIVLRPLLQYARFKELKWHRDYFEDVSKH